MREFFMVQQQFPASDTQQKALLQSALFCGIIYLISLLEYIAWKSRKTQAPLNGFQTNFMLNQTQISRKTEKAKKGAILTMTKDRSLEISAYIGRIITEQSPRIRWTSSELDEFYSTYTPDELEEMREIGILHDPSAFFVMQRFLYSIGLDETDGDYLLPLLTDARCLDAEEFRQNPYIASVKTDEKRMGDILLTTASYSRGEILQYAMPDFSADIVTLKLGFFDRTVKFPTIYEKGIPWMSVCPSEITSMADPISRAHGNVLVLGLGLGYYPFMISLSDNVGEITIIEKNKSIISLFERFLLPQFPKKQKIRVICADAIEWLGKSTGEYDFCFADIWEGVHDGLPLYKKIRSLSDKLPETEFAYWIEEQILGAAALS